MSIDFSAFPRLDITTAVPQAGFRCDPSAMNRLKTETQGGRPMTAEEIAASRNNLRDPRSTPVQQIDILSDAFRKGFQSDYTVADAAASLWKREYMSFNINDPDSINKWYETQQERARNGLLEVNPSEEELTAYIEKLRQDGLDGTVDWSDLTGEFRTFWSLKPDDLEDSLNYLASRYVAVLDKLERNFSGDALAEQKAKLNDVWQNAVSAMVDDYTSRLRDNLGISDADAQAVRDSFSAILDEKIAADRGALGQVSGALSGPDASWLQNCDAYIAAQLRGQETGESTSAAYYTVQDLAMAGQISQLYQTEIFNASSGYPNEARLALNLAMADMMGEEMISRGLVSGNMAALLRGSRAQGHENVLNAANERLAFRENTRSSGEPAGCYGTINRNVFQGIYQTVMDKFRETGGDAMEAIRAGAAYGQKATAQAHAQNPKVFRWDISMEQYWKGFYTTPAYGNGSESPFQYFANKWHNFIKSIGGGLEARG